MAQLQSNLVPLKLSSDGGTTYKSVVCKKSWTLNNEISTTEDQTDCGVLLGLGTNSWGFDIEGVVETAPSVTQFSAEDLLGFTNGQTLLKVKLDYPAAAGTDFYAQGDCYLTSFKLNNSVGSLMSFTATIKGTGALDITP